MSSLSSIGYVSTEQSREKFIEQTIEHWLFELQHQKTFSTTHPDLDDPYVKAMLTFQSFTDSVIQALHAHNPNILDLASQGVLSDIYTGLPEFDGYNEYRGFLSWVKDATLKHPLRRTAKQHQYLQIVVLQNDTQLSLKSKLLAGAAELQSWKDRAYAPESLINDPEALYFFHQKAGFTTASFSFTGPNPTIDDTDCPICTNAFHADACIPKRAPCGHTLCATCFKSWLAESKGAYTCPLCRACIVCGVNDCKHHAVYQDHAPPVPLPVILNAYLPDKGAVVLHGLRPDAYWRLREETRGDRATWAYIEAVLQGYDLEEGSRGLLKRDQAEVRERVRKEVIKAVLEKRPEGWLI